MHVLQIDFLQNSNVCSNKNVIKSKKNVTFAKAIYVVCKHFNFEEHFIWTDVCSFSCFFLSTVLFCCGYHSKWTCMGFILSRCLWCNLGSSIQPQDYMLQHRQTELPVETLVKHWDLHFLLLVLTMQQC